MSSTDQTRYARRVAAAVAFAALGVACGSGKKDSGFVDPNADGGAFAGADGGLGSSGGNGLLTSGCATATADAQRAPIYMQIILDGSGSMGDDNKWAADVPALDSIFDDVLAKNDPAFGVGLIAFSDKYDPTCQTITIPPFPPMQGNCAGPYPSKVDVPIAFVDQGQRDKLRGRIQPSSPSGDTPTKSALTGAFQSIAAFTPQAPLLSNGKKVVVLMTDGVPTDSTAGEDASLVSSELSKGISTFVVGVGPFPSSDPKNYDPAFLGQVAVAGGASPSGCNPSESSDPSRLCYFQVTPGGKSAAQLTQEFIDAINKIRSAVATCEFILTKAGGAVDPSQVNVLYTDQTGAQHVLVQDGVNGWTYDDPKSPSKVILHGADCDSVKSDPKGKIAIVLGCATVTK